MKRALDPLRLDVAAFAKAGGRLEGTWPLAELPRLAASGHEDMASAAAAVAAVWQATGEERARRGGAPDVWLHVEASATLALVCQRCLGPVATTLDARRSFLFVDGEERAAELDAEMDDDVLALPRHLDLRSLVEDELLLALPLVPRHAVCPQPLPHRNDDSPAEEERPNPFAALRTLRREGED
jgi:uncharacterized protein